MKAGENNIPREGGSGDSRLSDHGFPDTDHKDDGNSSGGSTPRGDLVGSALGVFSLATGKSPARTQKDSSDESEGKTAIHKILASKAEALIGKQWPWKGNEQETSEPKKNRFGWPWLQGEPDSDQTHSSMKAENHVAEFNRPAANEAYGSWSSFNVNSTSSVSSCGSASSSAVNKLDIDTDCLDYEIMWEDLTIGEQIGQGKLPLLSSCMFVCVVFANKFWR